MVDLGSLGGTVSYAFAINDSGLIVGRSQIVGDQHQVAVSYTNGSVVPLGSLGGDDSEALAINNNGIIVGDSWTVNDAADHAFEDIGGTLTDLGTLGGLESRAEAINDNGVIVGDSTTSGWNDDRAFIEDDGQMTDLNSLVTNLPADFVLEEATAINDSGQILANGAFELPGGSGQYESFLLTPVPERFPGLMSAIPLGLLLLLHRKTSEIPSDF
jgi:probable HAF family extracellular repeat protein